MATTRRAAHRKPPVRPRRDPPTEKRAPDHGNDVDLRGFTPTPRVVPPPRDLGAIHPADTRGTQHGG